jgi:hypothetical protein
MKLKISTRMSFTFIFTPKTCASAFVAPFMGVYTEGSLTVRNRLRHLVLCVLLILASIQQVFSQQPTYTPSLPCLSSIGNAAPVTRNSFSAGSLAVRSVSGGAGMVINDLWKVKTDAYGQVGVFHTMTVSSSTLSVCVNQPSNSRQFALYFYAGGVCTGAVIAAPTVANDGQVTGVVELITLNPVWIGLTLNADYVLVVKTTLGANCASIMSTHAGYYGNAVPCPVGGTAPTLSPTTISNTCPTTPVNLNSLVTSSPANTRVRWRTVATNPTPADSIVTPSV